MTKDLSDLQGEDIIDVRDIISRVEELRDQKTDRWVAGQLWADKPQYTSQEEFTDCDEAREHLVELLQERRSDLDDCFMNDHRMEPGKRAIMKGLMDDLEDASDKLIDAVASEPEADYSNTLGGVVYYARRDGEMGLDEDEAKELATLEGVLDDLKGYGGMEQWEGDWYPITLVRRGYFVEFAENEAEECDLIKKDARWPNNHIDWEAAAAELEQDYSEVDFDGTEYLYRG